MAKLNKEKTFFVAKDLDHPESKPGALVSIYYEDWDSKAAVIEGWRGPEMNSEDFPRKRLEPYSCQHLMVDIGGFWDCFSGTVIY